MPLNIEVLLFLDCALGVVTIATLAYLASGRRPETRFALVLSLLLIAGFFALSPLPLLRDAKARATFGPQLKERQEKQWCLLGNVATSLSVQRAPACQPPEGE